MNNHDRINQVFQENYSDLGLYRWANRNKESLKQVYAGTLIVCLLASTKNEWFIFWWAIAFIGLILILGIEHLWIGLRFKKILRILAQEDIHISLGYLLHIVDMPQ